MSLRAFEGQGGLFHISPQKTEPKLVALKLKHRKRRAEIKRIRSWLAQFRKWINCHLSVCGISTLNPDHCCHLPTEKCNFDQSFKLWFRPDELTLLAADAKNKATRIFTKPTFRSSYFRLTTADFRLSLNATRVICALIQQVAFLYSIWQRPEWSKRCWSSTQMSAGADISKSNLFLKL